MSCEKCTETAESAMDLDVQRRKQLFEICELALDGMKGAIGNEPALRAFDAIYQKAYGYARLIALPEDNPFS